MMLYRTHSWNALFFKVYSMCIIVWKQIMNVTGGIVLVATLLIVCYWHLKTFPGLEKRIIPICNIIMILISHHVWPVSLIFFSSKLAIAFCTNSAFHNKVIVALAILQWVRWFPLCVHKILYCAYMYLWTTWLRVSSSALSFLLIVRLGHQRTSSR